MSRGYKQHQRRSSAGYSAKLHDSEHMTSSFDGRLLLRDFCLQRRLRDSLHCLTLREPGVALASIVGVRRQHRWIFAKIKSSAFPTSQFVSPTQSSGRPTLCESMCYHCLMYWTMRDMSLRACSLVTRNPISAEKDRPLVRRLARPSHTSQPYPLARKRTGGLSIGVQRDSLRLYGVCPWLLGQH